MATRLQFLVLAGLLASHSVVLGLAAAGRTEQLPHPPQRSAFEIVLERTEAMEGGGGRRKLLETQELQHWTELAEWEDSLADPRKPVRWGLADTEDDTARRPLQSERSVKRGGSRRLLAEDEPGRRMLIPVAKQSLGLTAKGNMGPTQASLNGSLVRWDSLLAPASVDWRNTLVITVVKTQGNCASCWSLAAADSISMMWAIQSGQGRLPFNSSAVLSLGDPQSELWGKLDVSPQEICDCGLGTCCQGGWPEWAFQYVMNNGGVSPWQDYPYFKIDNTCQTALKSTLKAQISGWELVPARNPQAARKAVAQQPFVAFISASSVDFQLYRGGFFNGSCSEDLDHVVVVVGYGTNAQWGPFWIIKNSWGINWGDGGYMFLKASSGVGHCGIHAAPGLYPTYFPVNQDLTKWLPNPCGRGNVSYPISLGLLTTPTRMRCTCPEGFVENLSTNPAMCVSATPCSANPNPCGGGNCTNMKDGSYACSCPNGHRVGALTDGSPTCVPNNKQGGASTITVNVGTTAQSIIRGYNITQQAFVQLNPWVNTALPIPAGATIIIAPAADTSVTSMYGCVRNYIVQVGDTCQSIATTSRVTVTQITTENPLINCSNLIPATELCLQRTSINGPAPPECGLVYESQDGDTCVSVRGRANLTEATFAALNAGVNCSRPLVPGTPLCIGSLTSTSPSTCVKTYIVQPGDTCVTLMLMANLTQAYFLSLNPAFRCAYPYLQVGQVVCLESSKAPDTYSNLISYTVQSDDTLGFISESFAIRCGPGASMVSICRENNLANCTTPTTPPAGLVLRIPCTKVVGRSCGCSSERNSHFGSDGVWYNNYCEAVCNYALPATKTSGFCRGACKYRAGLPPANDPNNQCSSPCPWPQWNPRPDNWSWFADTFCEYYLGACQDWCSSSANTVCAARDNWSNWNRVYNDCVSACRSRKC